MGRKRKKTCRPFLLSEGGTKVVEYFLKKLQIGTQVLSAWFDLSTSGDHSDFWFFSGTKGPNARRCTWMAQTRLPPLASGSAQEQREDHSRVYVPSQTPSAPPRDVADSGTKKEGKHLGSTQARQDGGLPPGAGPTPSTGWALTQQLGMHVPLSLPSPCKSLGGLRSPQCHSKEEDRTQV